MYFWKIKNLKTDLSNGELPTKEQFKYIMAEAIVYAVAVAIIMVTPPLSSNWFDVAMVFITLITMMIGVYYVYYCNGGKTGERLLERYISLGWVVGVRWLVLIALPVLFGFFVFYGFFVVHEIVSEIPDEILYALPDEMLDEMLGEMLDEMSYETGVADIVVNTILIAVYYYLVGKHIRDIK